MKNELLTSKNPVRNREIRRVVESGEWLQPTRRIHSGLFVITLIMICFGLVMLFSASMSDAYDTQAGNSMYYVIKQAGITAMGLVAALVVATLVPVRFFDHFALSLGLYGLTTALLFYVKLFGLTLNGAKRWVNLGVAFQPSELAKLAMVFCFAGYVAMIRRLRAKGKLRFRSPLRQFLADGWLDILIPATAILVWIGLILWQPHLSCALIMCFLLLTIFLAAGIRFRSWLSAITQFLVILLIVAALFAAMLPLLKSTDIEKKITENFQHVPDRINSFLNPEEASSDDTYQIDQSIIAIGSGGLTGVGLGEGRQKYNYLPEAYNDFIFAIIGEELGFVGTIAVLLLFILFLLIGSSIALKAANPFAAVLASGYTMLIAIQGLLNMAVATRTVPPTGISLPFFSYGGTSNLFFLIGIGFILAVSRTGQKNSREMVQAGRLRPAQPETRGGS